MAVTLLKHYERFAGLSTDVKPANAPMGSTFFEWDTSKLYTLSPAGWVEKKGTIHGDVQLSGSKVVDAVIDISDDAKVSSEIDFRNYKYLSFLMPAAWDTATLTIYGSATAGGTKVPIKNDVGQTFPAMTVAVDTIYTIDANALIIAGVQYLALVSSADQTADRTIKVMLEQ